ncbi:uncharacterized protein LOC144427207 isoform X2 [Styela clava]
MKIIVASFPKCGTKTLRDCLRILGYIVYDFDENFTFLGEEWAKVFKNGPSVRMFKEMYERVDAVSDIPASTFWRTLHKAFPEAKIVLTTRRNEEKWLQSWLAQVDAIHKSKMSFANFHFTPTGRKFLQFMKKSGESAFSRMPKSKYFIQDAEALKREYRMHNSAVKQEIPKDKLLIFKFSDGWEPLCKFLEKDIPDVPFPHSNKGAAVRERHIAPMVFSKMDHELSCVAACLAILIGILLYLSIQVIC